MNIIASGVRQKRATQKEGKNSGIQFFLICMPVQLLSNMALLYKPLKFCETATEDTLTHSVCVQHSNRNTIYI